MAILCQCACNSDAPTLMPGQEEGPEPNSIWPPSRARELGLVSYSADLQQPLVGPPLRVGDVWHLLPEDGKSFEQATLSLHANGILIKPFDGRQPLSIAWSPFSLVQACRLHSVQADAALPWLRLFKVSVFQHGSTHFFAAQGDEGEADAQRARWVADISRALRVLSQSLFPEFSLRAEPLPGAGWTATRLLAGYLLLCDDQGVSLVYCELHSHWDCAATFAAYEDEYCDTQVVRLGIDMHTCVSERVGVDCSCFSFDGYHFTTRTCAEKMLWLRAISNVKVKLRHRAPNPSPQELKEYRSSILEYAQGVRPPDGGFTRSALLPRRAPRRGHLPPTPGAGPSGGTPSNVCPGGPTAGVNDGGGFLGSGVDNTGTEGDPIDSEGLGMGPAPSASRLQQLPSPHKLTILIEPQLEGDDLPSPLPPEPPPPSSGRTLPHRAEGAASKPGQVLVGGDLHAETRELVNVAAVTSLANPTTNPVPSFSGVQQSPPYLEAPSFASFQANFEPCPPSLGTPQSNSITEQPSFVAEAEKLPPPKSPSVDSCNSEPNSVTSTSDGKMPKRRQVPEK
eukprot:TRINITY_DN5195_c0_g2_i2.p1 TRINITY_DN5195_c0_g2~~TRINITY_DN5195_c0_g2_i2.p1  ORF type:complete len:566 (-),score=91.01 TRINITY_DN5195_c0_g2_i2:72-1769(-)